jgi:FkbM family methyltransferase
MNIHVDRLAPSLSCVKADLERALASLPLRLTSRHSVPYLEIAGHRPIAHPAMQKIRSLFGLRKTRKIYEETTTALVSHLITRFRPRHFFDIGAHNGYFSRVATSHIASPSQVQAFEMRPDSFGALKENFARHAPSQKMTAHHTALTDKHKGVIDVWMARSLLFERKPALRDYRESWYRRLKFWLRGMQSRGLISARIKITSLDHFVASTGVVPDMIKIDVDGYEMNVLRGAVRTLAREKPIVLLELHTDRKLRFGTSRQEVVAQLFDLGYEALLFTDHHDRTACQVRQVTACSPVLRRQETDLLLFMHPQSTQWRCHAMVSDELAPARRAKAEARKVAARARPVAAFQAEMPA